MDTTKKVSTNFLADSGKLNQNWTIGVRMGYATLLKIGQGHLWAMSLIFWSQILLRNSSENFRSDIAHPNLVLKSDNENSDHFLSGI